jgi:hypothetical protein
MNVRLPHKPLWAGSFERFDPTRATNSHDLTKGG